MGPYASYSSGITYKQFFMGQVAYQLDEIISGNFGPINLVVVTFEMTARFEEVMSCVKGYQSRYVACHVN